MKIGIDARFYGCAMQGLGRYTEELVLHLAKIDPENQYVLFMLKNTAAPNLPSNFSIVRVDFRWYSLKEQLFLPRVIQKQNLDLMHFVHFNVPILFRKKFIVTIHDLLLIKFPTSAASTRSKFTYWIKYFVYTIVLRSAIKRSEAILAVSENTKKDIIDYSDCNPAKVTVSLLGSEHFTVKEVDMKSSEKFALYVGNAYPHKNLKFLIQNFEPFGREHNVVLKLVGKTDYFYKKIQDFIASRGYVHSELLGFVSDQKLDQLYANAHIVIQPSLYEGFGFSVIEGMVHKTPVLASSGGSLPEITGEAALQFDPTSASDFTSKLKSIWYDAELRTTLVEKGMFQYKKFSWNETARITYQLYQRV